VGRVRLRAHSPWRSGGGRLVAENALDTADLSVGELGSERVADAGVVPGRGSITAGAPVSYG